MRAARRFIRIWRYGPFSGLIIAGVGTVLAIAPDVPGIARIGALTLAGAAVCWLTSITAWTARLRRRMRSDPHTGSRNHRWYVVTSGGVFLVANLALVTIGDYFGQRGLIHAQIAAITCGALGLAFLVGFDVVLRTSAHFQRRRLSAQQ